MLIEFSVSNYKSFADKQTLSMVAAPKLRKRENTFTPKLNDEKFPSLLKIAAVYGANASGKSTLLSAFGVLKSIATMQPSAVPEKLPVEAFRFDDNFLDKPSSFEYHLIINGVRYEFLLSCTKTKITEESLTYYLKGKPRLLYSRKNTDGKDEYVFGADLYGPPDMHVIWSKITGPRTLFISQVIANSSENIPLLTPFFVWITGRTYSVSSTQMRGWMHASKALIKEKSDIFVSHMTRFLSSFDIPISDVRFDPVDSDAEHSSLITDNEINRNYDFTGFDRAHRTLITHKTSLGTAEFDFDEESTGTQNLFGFWLPWSVMTADPSNPAGAPILLVDELDSSLHPQIVIELIRKHIKAPIPCQIIFTTHDAHILSQRLLRRDQIWITDRGIDGSTQLNSVYDFQGRESDNIEKKYFEGRYRGLPVIRKN